MNSFITHPTLLFKQMCGIIILGDSMIIKAVIEKESARNRHMIEEYGQWAFHTEKILEYLTFVECKEIK